MRTHLQRATAIMAASGGIALALAGWDATTSTPAQSPDSASSGELAGRQSRQSSANDASPSVDEVTAIEDGMKARKITIDSAYAPAID